MYGLSAATCECQFDAILNTHRSPLIRPEELQLGLCKAHPRSNGFSQLLIGRPSHLSSQPRTFGPSRPTALRIYSTYTSVCGYLQHHKNLNHLLFGYDAICKKKWAAGARPSVNANHPSLGDWYASTIDRRALQNRICWRDDRPRHICDWPLDS